MGELDFMLKPCFCGGKRTIECNTHSAGMGECYTDWEMKCDKCHGLWTLSADNFYGSTPYTELEAIQIWNDMVTDVGECECKLLEFDKVNHVDECETCELHDFWNKEYKGVRKND